MVPCRGYRIISYRIVDIVSYRAVSKSIEVVIEFCAPSLDVSIGNMLENNNGPKRTSLSVCNRDLQEEEILLKEFCAPSLDFSIENMLENNNGLKRTSLSVCNRDLPEEEILLKDTINNEISD